MTSPSSWSGTGAGSEERAPAPGPAPDPDAPSEASWARFREGAAALGVVLDASQEAALRRYLKLLREWNRRFNLTAIERPDEILVKHFLDSLTCALVVDFPNQSSLVDVGSGAGFPGLVLKIAFPHLRATLLDASEKRVRFLTRAAEELGLRGVVAVHGRAEELARESAAGLREAFDVGVARAVAPLNVLCEWLLPFVRVGGVAVAMKGPEIGPELEAAERAIRLLGGGDVFVRKLVLPGTEIGRSLVRIRKLEPTPPEYPRRPGAARKRPL